MTVPDFQSMMRPVLRLHADGLPHTSADVRDNVAQVLGVTEEDRQVPLPSGRMTRYANRVAWAVTHMAQALLLERPQRGVTPGLRQSRGMHPMSEYACRRNLPSDPDHGRHVALARDLGFGRIGRIATLTEPWFLTVSASPVSKS